MSTLREHYRTVFHAPGAQEVLQDLIGFVDRRSEGERAGGNAVLARITRMLHTPEPAARVTRAKTNGGRIAHG